MRIDKRAVEDDAMKTSLPQVARIVHVADESPQVRTFVLDQRLEAEPGQFVMVWLPGVDEKPFSLVHADPVRLTIARVGPFTAAVHGLSAGDRLWVRGPFGQPFTLPAASGACSPASQGPILLIGGGCGVAPLYFLAERARAAGRSVTMVIGVRTAADILFVERFESLGVQVIVSTDDGSLGRKGLATEAAVELLDSTNFEVLYACGPEPMLDAVERLAHSRKLPAQLSYERYMRCGFGVCGSCVRAGWLVCRDGPVRHVKPEA
jgi:dihydroorotate dehydrogenase electron transfer subunit